MFTPFLPPTPLPAFLSATPIPHASWAGDAVHVVLPELALGTLSIAAIWVACTLIAVAGLVLGAVVVGLVVRLYRLIRRRLTPDAYTALVTVTPDGARRITGTRRRFWRWRHDPQPPPSRR